MKLIKITISLILLLSINILADSDFNTANKLYESGKYAEAAKTYSDLLAQGNKCAEIYYNLGNAYFKDKKIGLAILNYEKAFKISPRDPDIRYNLDFSRNFIKDTAVEDSATKLINSIYNFLTINETCLLLSIIFTILLGLLIYRLFKNDEVSYWLTFAFSILFLIMLIFTGLRIYDNENTKIGIITTTSVEAKSAPLETNPVSFTIPEGKKVLILKYSQDWVEVLLKSENIKGWIKKDEVSEI